MTDRNRQIIFHLYHHHQHCLLVLVKVRVYLPHHHFEPFQPPPPRSDNSFSSFNIPVQQPPSFNNQKLSGNLFGSQTQALTREKEKVVKDNVQKELDDTICELPDPPKPELGDGLLNTLGVEADDTLEQEFVNKKQ